jgi:hypothetical protein
MIGNTVAKEDESVLAGRSGIGRLVVSELVDKTGDELLLVASST